MRLPSGIQDTVRLMALVKKILNGNIDILDNVYMKIVDVLDTGSANTEFTIIHGLGRVPAFYLVTTDRAASLYDSSRETWTSEQMKLKCSIAHTAIKILVF